MSSMSASTSASVADAPPPPPAPLCCLGCSDRHDSSVMEESVIMYEMSALGCCPNASGWSETGRVAMYSRYESSGPSFGT